MAEDWRTIQGNEHVFERLSKVIAGSRAIAFVGAGASAGLYPLWPQLIRRLADEALVQGFASEAARTFWCDPKTKPQQAVQGIKQALRQGAYAEALRNIFGRRKGPDGNSYTAVHAALMRLPFQGVVTTNYDLGLVDAQVDVRPGASSGYATWHDRDPVNRWLTEDIFRDQRCPILFAHGVCERTDTIVLGADEYRQAYATAPFSTLFNSLWGQRQLVFVGFGFSDPWLDFLADAAATRTAARDVAGPRHVAIFGLKPDESYTSERRRSFRDAYNADPLFYPISMTAYGNEDHSALLAVLQALRSESRAREPSADASDQPPPSRSESGTFPSGWTPTADQERMATKLLAKDEAAPLRQALGTRFGEIFREVMPSQPAQIAGWFATCPHDKAEQALDVVHGAILDVRDARGSAGIQPPAEEAAVALYCLAACRLVDRAVHEETAKLLGPSTLIKVPTDENVICGIIAVALFGGELRLEEAEPQGKELYPKAAYAFVVRRLYGGDLVADDFERAAFLAVTSIMPGAPVAGLDTGPLNNDQSGWLSRLLKWRLVARIFAVGVGSFACAEAGYRRCYRRLAGSFRALRTLRTESGRQAGALSSFGSRTRL